MHAVRHAVMAAVVRVVVCSVAIVATVDVMMAAANT
jgi:hypothetical protein